MFFQKIGNGKPIIFLHGWGCDGSIFLPIAKLLPNNKCYLIDFNGFGKSLPPPESGWGVENYADVLWLFFKQHNIFSACIVAHSFGCRVALVFAAKYPQLVKKIMLISPAGLRNFSFKRWCKVARYKLHKFGCKLCHKQSSATQFGSADYNACNQGMKNTFVKVVNQNLSSFARKVRCSTLIINGKQDCDTPLKQSKKLQRLMPCASLVEIEGGHFAFFQNPSAFAKTIEYFVGDLR